MSTIDGGTTCAGSITVAAESFTKMVEATTATAAAEMEIIGAAAAAADMATTAAADMATTAEANTWHP